MTNLGEIFLKKILMTGQNSYIANNFGNFINQYPNLYLGYNGFLVIGNLVIGLWIARKIKPLEKPVSIENTSENVMNSEEI